MNEFEYLANGHRLRRKLEGAALRAENVLMRIYSGQHQPQPIQSPALKLNGEGLHGLKRDAFLVAYRQSAESVTETSSLLKISRATAYKMKRQFLASTTFQNDGFKP